VFGLVGLDFEFLDREWLGSFIFSGLSDWRNGIGDQVLEGLSGDVMLVKDVVNSFIVEITLSGGVLAGIAGRVLGNKGSSVGGSVLGDIGGGVLADIGSGISSSVLGDVGGGISSRVLLGQGNGDWRRLVYDEVLEVTSGDVLTSESKHTI